MKITGEHVWTRLYTKQDVMDAWKAHTGTHRYVSQSMPLTFALRMVRPIETDDDDGGDGEEGRRLLRDTRTRLPKLINIFFFFFFPLNLSKCSDAVSTVKGRSALLM